MRENLTNETSRQSAPAEDFGDSRDSSWKHWVLLALAMAVAFAAYAPGLHGPMLLDDFVNLGVMEAYLAGERSAASVLFGNVSGPTGRPLAMASFLADAELFGNSLWHAKRSNLLLHLCNGVLLFVFLRMLLRRTCHHSSHLHYLPLIVTAVWLFLPLHVSTVFYLVQRMAILSALFVLVGLLVFLWSRTEIDRGRMRGHLALWIGVPLATLLAILSKESGALLPLLAGVVEVTCLGRTAGIRRPRSVQWFFAFTLALPVVMGALVVLVRPELILAAYEMRDFTLSERLMTQPRVLWNYVKAILVPYGPGLGLFHDNFPKSTGWFSPWTTIPAMVGWLLAVVLAWRWRRTLPLVSCGLLLFLAGHAMEAGFIALEIYFEHRNYLPSAGLLLCVAALTVHALSKLSAPSRGFRMAQVMLAILIPLVFAGSTLGRATVWSSETTLYTQELRHNPGSPRMRSMLVGKAIEAGRLDIALEQIAAAEAHFPERQAATITLWRLAAYCSSGSPVPDALYAEFARRAGARIEFYAMVAWEVLVRMVERGRCPQLDLSRMAGMIEVWIEGTTLAPSRQEVWRTRLLLARAQFLLERYLPAADSAYRAWKDSGRLAGPGVQAAQLAFAAGDHARSREILDAIIRFRGREDLAFDQSLDSLVEALGPPHKDSRE